MPVSRDIFLDFLRDSSVQKVTAAVITLRNQVLYVADDLLQLSNDDIYPGAVFLPRLGEIDFSMDINESFGGAIRPNYGQITLLNVDGALDNYDFSSGDISLYVGKSDWPLRDWWPYYSGGKISISKKTDDSVELNFEDATAKFDAPVLSTRIRNLNLVYEEPEWGGTYNYYPGYKAEETNEYLPAVFGEVRNFELKYIGAQSMEFDFVPSSDIESGVVTAYVNRRSCNLNLNSSYENGAFADTGGYILLYAGTEYSQKYKVKNYVKSTKTITIEGTFDRRPVAGTPFLIGYEHLNTGFKLPTSVGRFTDDFFKGMTVELIEGRGKGAEFEILGFTDQSFPDFNGTFLTEPLTEFPDSTTKVRIRWNFKYAVEGPIQSFDSIYIDGVKTGNYTKDEPGNPAACTFWYKPSGTVTADIRGLISYSGTYSPLIGDLLSTMICRKVDRVSGMAVKIDSSQFFVSFNDGFFPDYGALVGKEIKLYDGDIVSERTIIDFDSTTHECTIDSVVSGSDELDFDIIINTDYGAFQNNDLNMDSFSAINLISSNPAGIGVYEQSTISDVIDEIVKNVSVYVYVDIDGKLSISRFKINDSAVDMINELSSAGNVTIENAQRYWNINAKYAKNYQKSNNFVASGNEITFDSSEFLTAEYSNPAVLIEDRNAQKYELNIPYYDRETSLNIAKYFLSLVGEKRIVVTVETNNALSLLPGQTVVFSDEKHKIHYKKMVVISMKANGEIRLWG